jgi:hypothetical protein
MATQQTTTTEQTTDDDAPVCVTCGASMADPIAFGPLSDSTGEDWFQCFTCGAIQNPDGDTQP